VADDDGLPFAVQAALTLLIVVLMVPGLIVEPGPVSEVLGLAAIGAVWGVDLGGDGGGGGG
jgi:hypothetical protein